MAASAFGALTGFGANLARSLSSTAYARRRGLPGIDYADYGRKLGLRLLARGVPRGADYLVCPLSSVRYFEFDFCRRVTYGVGGECLDVSSPFLFSFRKAEEERDRCRITMINPDNRDADRSRRMLHKLSIKNVACENASVEAWLAGKHHRYDAIWAISVVEHIWPENGDVAAVRLMWEALSPGGVIAITVPVDREFRVERRGERVYGTEIEGGDESGFPFQRWYDEEALRHRIAGAIGAEPERIEWFGELLKDWWPRYESLWMEEGATTVVDDPRLFADWFRRYDAFEQMPGAGVAAVVFRKH